MCGGMGHGIRVWGWWVGVYVGVWGCMWVCGCVGGVGGCGMMGIRRGEDEKVTEGGRVTRKIPKHQPPIQLEVEVWSMVRTAGTVTQWPQH